MDERPEVPDNAAFAARCYAWSRAIHWVTVALLSGLLLTALFYDIDPHGSGNRAFLWHSSLGLAVYLLSIARVLLWFVYRPTASGVGKPDTGVPRGLRLAFYALLVALPFSGWLLASQEGMPAHVFGIPALPQWYHQEHAARSGSTNTEINRNDAAREAPVVLYFTRLHAGLGAALAIVIALHLFFLMNGTRKRRTDVHKRELPAVEKERSRSI